MVHELGEDVDRFSFPRASSSSDADRTKRCRPSQIRKRGDDLQKDR
jgi:hypothetical protein